MRKPMFPGNTTPVRIDQSRNHKARRLAARFLSGGYSDGQLVPAAPPKASDNARR